MNEPNYTILVCSCDSYADLWEPFFLLLKKYWPGCAAPIVLNTESRAFAMPGLDIRCPQLYNGQEKPPYGRRLRETLRLVKTPFVLLMLDDFFLRAPVDEARLQKIAAWMEQNPNIACFNFENSMSGKPSTRYPGFQTLPPVAEYKLNMQAGMWRTQDLYALWRPRETPWQWETVATRRTFNSAREFYYLQPGTPLLLDYGKKPGLTWGVVRGKWCRADVEPLFFANNIRVDLSRRGFFDESAQTALTPTPPLEATRQLIYSTGVWYACKSICYSTMTLLGKLLLKKPRKTYEEHLAEKCNAGF